MTEEEKNKTQKAMSKQRTEHEATMAAQTSELQTPSSEMTRDELKKKLQDQRRAKNNGQTLEEYETQRNDIVNTLNHPVDRDKLFGLGDKHIGNFDILIYNSLQNLTAVNDPNTPPEVKEYLKKNISEIRSQSSTENLSPTPESPDKLIDHSKLHIINHTEDSDEARAGFYDIETHTTTIKLYPECPLDLPQSISNLVHETNHKKQHENDGSETLITPANSYRIDRLDETTAYASNCLTVAQLYTTMKEQGIETTQLPYDENIIHAYSQWDIEHNPLPRTQEEAANYKETKFSEFLKQQEDKKITVNGESLTADNLLKKYPELAEKKLNELDNFFQQNNLDVKITQFKEVPTEEILNAYPGLKNVVMEKGFNANDPQSVRNVVEVASQNWHIYYKGKYKNLHLLSSNAKYTGLPFSEQIETLRNEDKAYQEVSANVLKKVYIGQNRYVDLTDCRDLLDTCSKKEALSNLKSNGCTYPSLQEMEAINNHLEKKGLTTDEQKHTYLKEFINKTLYREETNDPELLKIMLADNRRINYADGIEVTYNKNGEPMSVHKNNAHNDDCLSYRIDPSMFAADNKNKQTTQDLTANPPQQEQQTPNSTKLNPALIMKLQKQR